MQLDDVTYADLQIKVGPKETEGYALELTLNRNQEYHCGYLDPTILTWIPKRDAHQDGTYLFEWLCGANEFEIAWADIRAQYPNRRIRLRIDPIELQDLPWECLYEPQYGNKLSQNLAAAKSTPFSRYLPGPWSGKILPQPKPIKLLIIIADPENLPQYHLDPIDTTFEQKLLQNALDTIESPTNITPIFLPQPATLSMLAEALQEGFDILHIIAHGNYSRASGQPLIYLANKYNQVMPVTAHQLTETIKRQTNPNQAPSLVFLSACQSAQGVAQELIGAGIPAILAMQDQIPIETARSFTKIFYQRLFTHGQPDLAANEARSSLLTNQIPGHTIPIFFSRLENGHLLKPPDTPILDRLINPFGITGRLEDPVHYLARSDLHWQILDELSKGISLSLVGESGSGTSSLLWHIAHVAGPRILKDREWVYLNLEIIHNDDDFFELLCEELGVPTCRGIHLARHLRERQIVLCLDEIEKMTGFSQTARSELRGLAHGINSSLTLIIASRTPLERLFPDTQEQTSPLANICYKIQMPAFTSEEAQALVDQYLLPLGLNIPRSIIEKAWQYSRGNPYRLQQTLRDIFNKIFIHR